MNRRERQDELCEKLQGSDLLEIGRMLGSMVEKADSFCNAAENVVREDHCEYFVEDDED